MRVRIKCACGQCDETLEPLSTRPNVQKNYLSFVN